MRNTIRAEQEDYTRNTYIRNVDSFCFDAVGRISFIQEPGYKLRAVANPNRVLQLALEPLKVGVLHILEYTYGQYAKDRTDFTTDQQLGISKVQSWLQNDQVVHSVDLSDATNNFPLTLQLKYMRLMNDTFHEVGSFHHECFEDYLQVWQKVSTSTWEMKGLQGGIRWSVGQPLGLGPSFPIFALSHNMLLDSLTQKHGGNFVVLGDDVAIVGDDLHKAYRSALVTLDCPVSEHKCLSSDRCAEFAGKVITKDATLNGYKWKQVSDHSFLDHCKLLGQKSARVLRPQQRKVFNLIAEIPEELGGLGFNPKGKTWSQRVDENQATIDLLSTTTEKEIPVVRARSQVDALRTKLAMRIRDPVGCRNHPDYPTTNLSDVQPLKIQPSRLGEGELRYILELKNYARSTPIKVPQDDFEARAYKAWIREGSFPVTPDRSDPRGPSQLEILQEKLKLKPQDPDDGPPRSPPRRRR
jgi:hypothetical protein